MASLDMSPYNMVQNNRRNGARGGGRVRGIQGVRGPGGEGRGMRGVSCPGGQGRGMRGVSCPGGQGRRLRDVSCPGGQRRGMRGVSCPGGQGRRLRDVICPGGQRRGMRDVSCPRGQRRGMRGVICPGGQRRGMRGVSCPGGQRRGMRGVSCPGGQGRGLRGVSFSTRKQRGLRGVSCPARKQKGLQGVRGPGGQQRGLRDVRCPGRRGRDLRGVRGPIRGVVRSVVRQHRSPLGIHSIVKAMRRTRNFPCQNSVLGDRLKAATTSGVESGTKLQVSNLNAGVSNEDITELFSEIGEVVQYGIQYDKNGMPCGSAEVVFARRGDAFQAVKRYNNAQLDGNPMKIENVRSISRARLASRMDIVGGKNGRRTVHMREQLAKRKSLFMQTRNRPGPGYMRNRPCAGHMREAVILNHDVGPSCQRPRGWGNDGVPVCGSCGRGRGRRDGGLGGRLVEKSVEELDKEPEIYQAETMQTVQ